MYNYVMCRCVCDMHVVHFYIDVCGSVCDVLWCVFVCVCVCECVIGDHSLPEWFSRASPVT